MKDLLATPTALPPSATSHLGREGGCASLPLISDAGIQTMALTMRAKLIDDNGGSEECIETQSQIAKAVHSALAEFAENLTQNPLSILEGGPFGNAGPLPAYDRWLDYHSGALFRRMSKAATVPACGVAV